jgi:hypothetical protein
MVALASVTVRALASATCPGQLRRAGATEEAWEEWNAARPARSVADGRPDPVHEGGLGSERGLATPSPDAKGREPSALSDVDHAAGTLTDARTQL